MDGEMTHTAEIDALRTLYNASIANGLVLRAKHYERRINALLREQARDIPPGKGDA